MHDYRSRTASASASIPRSDANFDAMPPASVASTQSLARKRRRSKGPDWTEFYKNGLPKEVIVIDDDTPAPSADATSTRTCTNGTIAGSDAGSQHISKKRRKEDGYVNGGRVVNGSHIVTPNSGTSSTDRTTSAQHTTAPTTTSVASLSSNGHFDHEVSSQSGQKRKRTTRQQLAQEAKRREVEVLGDAYVSYRPPQKPIKKSAEVAVRVVTDVRLIVTPPSGSPSNAFLSVIRMLRSTMTMATISWFLTRSSLRNVRTFPRYFHHA